MLAGALLTACPGSNTPEQTILVRIGDEIVTTGDYELRFRRVKRDLGDIPVLEPEAMRGLKQRLLAELIDERLLLQAAAAAGVSVEDAAVEAEVARLRESMGDREWRRFLLEHYVDERAWMEGLRARMTVDALVDRQLELADPVTEPELRRLYEQDPGQFRRPLEVRLRQIVVDEPGLAENLRARLRRGANFEALAREHSIGPEAARGGDMGRIRPVDLPASFRPAFVLEPGQISDVVRTEYGFHIFQAVDRRPASQLAFEDVRDRIERELLEERRQALRESLLAELHGRVPVRVEEAAWQRMLERL